MEHVLEHGQSLHPWTCAIPPRQCAMSTAMFCAAPLHPAMHLLNKGTFTSASLPWLLGHFAIARVTSTGQTGAKLVLNGDSNPANSTDPSSSSAAPKIPGRHHPLLNCYYVLIWTELPASRLLPDPLRPIFISSSPYFLTSKIVQAVQASRAHCCYGTNSTKSPHLPCRGPGELLQYVLATHFLTRLGEP
ncbi:hypothetical protein BD289DRAFT_73600 [Coniella lustricola]|uniref:Uncharacterized protein n=1 Tax=Coniella lustricola TaxID=2025994 RepID=A0A2T3AHN8_9PEZI|nr:hypothetical protein BD289DRAFT_73600 [Coniella lustricola]